MHFIHKTQLSKLCKYIYIYILYNIYRMLIYSRYTFRESIVEIKTNTEVIIKKSRLKIFFISLH